MLKVSALALLGAMTLTSAAQMRAVTVGPAAPPLAAAIDDATGGETLTIYYSPLDSTKVARELGFGMAYHMALVYTDKAGVSHGASSGPSDLRTPQTPTHALTAVLASFDDAPSAFGTLASDPRNDTPFVKGGSGDDYTRGGAGRPYPSSIVLRGKDLSARWSSILGTYARIGAMKLTYSPVTQNSNSLAATALSRAGVRLAYSSGTVFVPGAFTQLP